MKKLVLVLLVAMLSVPAFAAPAIDLVDLGSGVVALDYIADTNLISGMGIKITLTGSTVKSFTNGTTKYWVHPSNIIIDGGAVTTIGSPVVEANPVGLAEFTVEYGALYDRSNPADPNKPAASGRLCTFEVNGNCTVSATSNTVQGGVVTEALTAFTNLTDSVVVATSLPAPTVASITPATGVYGTTVTVTNLAGTNFVSGATVKLTKSGSADIAGTDVVFVSDSKLTCKFVLPYLAISGTWNVVVTNPDTQATTQTVAFVVTTPAAVPTVTSILATGGAAGFTTSVTDLIGTNFVSGATVKLTLAGQSDILGTSVVFGSATKLSCKFAVPAGAVAGPWSVVVTNPDARSATKASAFTVGDCFAQGAVGSAQRTAYTKWVAFNKPSCWCFRKQCRGDADGLSAGMGTSKKPVVIGDLTIYKDAYNKPYADVLAVPSRICADFDKLDAGMGTSKKPVVIADLTIYKEYYNDVDGTVPACTAAPIPSNAAVNFWTN